MKCETRQIKIGKRIFRSFEKTPLEEVVRKKRESDFEGPEKMEQRRSFGLKRVTK